MIFFIHELFSIRSSGWPSIWVGTAKSWWDNPFSSSITPSTIWLWINLSNHVSKKPIDGHLNITRLNVHGSFSILTTSLIFHLRYKRFFASVNLEIRKFFLFFLLFFNDSETNKENFFPSSSGNL